MEHTDPVMSEGGDFADLAIKLHEYSRQLRETLAPDITKILQGFNGQLAEIQKMVQVALEPLHRNEQHLRRIMEEFQKTLQTNIGPAIEQFQRGFRELPPHTRQALLLLAEHGWYMDFEMPVLDLWHFQETFEKGDIQEAENELVAYFESKLDEIEKTITKRFPHRAHLIKSAFLAHRRQEYELSIPVFLAQTDGICGDFFGHSPFMKNRQGKPQTSFYIEQIGLDTLRAAMLSPLGEPIPINFSKKARTVEGGILNRHSVLHGESLDYGKKTYGLMAISLINYVTQIIELEKDETQ